MTIEDQLDELERNLDRVIGSPRVEHYPGDEGLSQHARDLLFDCSGMSQQAEPEWPRLRQYIANLEADKREYGIEVARRTYAACARSEGFQSARDADWSVDCTAIATQVLTSFRRRQPGVTSHDHL